jgi:pyruvate dehydrogenase E2 component (dihydrolipoamide acetyltransferase)
MAATEIKLPDIGEGVNEGEIVRWLVKEGDSVAHDQPLVEVMTDKATVEIPCSAAGKVVKIIAKEGQIVKVGGALLTMDSGAGASTDASPSPAPAKAAQPAQPESGAPPPAPAQAPSAPKVATAQAAGQPSIGDSQEVSPPAAGADVLATPATRRYAREAGVDLNKISGTGPVGRITREDVVNAGTQSSGNGAVAAGAKPQFKALLKPLAAGEAEERKPFRGIRRKIAENLVRSKQIIPHFTHADECDVTELVAWRTKMKDEAASLGVKLTYLPFIMKAVAITCREFPNFNASIDDAASEIVIKHQFNIGFAADTAEGLLVPVVKNVESKSILEIAHDISELAEKARMGKLAVDDMKHGTLTVTNIGSIGGVYATPIINHPEVCILGVYKIQKKPVVVNGEIKIRDMMGVTATCDHRLIDGAQAAKFLNKLMKRLENPQSLLLEMI